MNKDEYIRMGELEETHWWFVAKRNFIKSVFPQTKKLKILDIGAGTGGTTKFLGKYSEVVGLEKSDLARSLAKRKGIILKKGRGEDVPFKNNSFDGVAILDVLYHKDIESDIKVIEEATRVLRPGGYLVITDSALEFLRSSHDRAVATRHRYTKEELVRKVKKAGFKVEKVSYIFFFVFPLVFIFRILGKLSKESDSDLKPLPGVVNDALIRLCLLEAKLLKFVNMPIGSSVILKARKN